MADGATAAGRGIFKTPQIRTLYPHGELKEQSLTLQIEALHGLTTSATFIMAIQMAKGMQCR